MKDLLFVKVIGLTLLVFLLTGCNQENVFNGEKSYIISDFPESKTLEGVELDADLLGVSDIACYDSVIMLCTPKLDKMYRLVSQNTGETLSEIITKGQGPNELLRSFSPMYYERVDDDVNMTIIDYVEEKIKSINLNKVRVLDSPKIDVSHIPGIYGAHKYDNEHLFVDYLQQDTISQRYGLMNIHDGKVKTFPQKIDGADIGGMINSYLLATAPAFNGAKKKYATAMTFLSQINIIDIENPDKSFCLVTSDYDLTMTQVAKSTDRKRFYIDIESDDNFIYALTQGGGKGEEGRLLHVFDWDGKPIMDIAIKEPLSRVCFNPETRTLFGISELEQLYAYRLPL